MFLLPFGMHITQNVLCSPLLLNFYILLWLASEVLLILLLLLDVAVQSWELKHEQEIAARVCTYVTEHNDCTYDELAVHCMPRKIHVGLESAVQRLISSRKIVRYSDKGISRLRLPTEEERLIWYIECGVTLRVSELSALFETVVPDYDNYLDVEFFLFETLRCRMGQTSPSEGQADPFWICSEALPKTTFSSFENMFSARLFDDKALRDLWDDALVTEINGEYAERWMHIYDSHYH